MIAYSCQPVTDVNEYKCTPFSDKCQYVLWRIKMCTHCSLKYDVTLCRLKNVS